jgi:hypothetical protein
MDIEEQIFKRHEESFVTARVEMDQARAKWQALVEAAYQDGEQASAEMEAFRAKHGNDALYERLAAGKDLHEFGRRHGSILSLDLSDQAKGRRANSDEARADLAQAFKSLQEKVRAASLARSVYEQAERDRQRRASPSQDEGGKSGGSDGWSRNYAKRRADEMVAAGKEPPRPYEKDQSGQREETIPGKKGR